MWLPDFGSGFGKIRNKGAEGVDGMKYTELLIYLIRSRISITGIGKNSGRFRSIVKHLERLLEEKKNKVRRGCNGQNVVVQKPDNRYNIEKKVRKCRY